MAVGAAYFSLARTSLRCENQVCLANRPNDLADVRPTETRVAISGFRPNQRDFFEMEREMRIGSRGLIARLAGIAAAALAAGAAFGQSTFTYQGRLTHDGDVVDNPSQPLIFELYDQESGGSPLPDSTIAVNVAVEDGLFTVELAMPPELFNGSNRWLQIYVNGSALLPRQKVTAAPYALHTRGLDVDANGNVGIGAGARVGRNPADSFSYDGKTMSHYGLGWFGDSWNASGSTGWLSGYGGLKLFTHGEPRVAVDFDGNVGIGADLPKSTLHVLKGSSGVAAPEVNSPLVLEGDSNTFINILAPETSQQGIYFGKPSDNDAGGIIYDGVSAPDGFMFRANGATKMVIESTGQVGIGTPSPDEMLEVDGTVQMDGFKMKTVGVQPGMVLTATSANGDGTWQTPAPAGGSWSLTGNSGTTAGTNFIGTTDVQAFEIKVGNHRVLRFEHGGGGSNADNIIGGHPFNFVSSGVFGATISGGGDGEITGSSRNAVTDDWGVVGGGLKNTAGNSAGSAFDAAEATVAGGFNNTASGPGATVGGGGTNTASGDESTVPGGSLNTAAGRFSFAAGNRAKANHDGAFAWGDSTNADVATTAINQFIVRATGGVWFGANSSPSMPAGRFINTSTNAHLTTGGIWTNNSDRNAKTNIAPVDPRDTLEILCRMPIFTWNYNVEDDSVRHMGPMAQDFWEAFGLGSDEGSIGTLDADGVALTAIQGLCQMVQERQDQLDDLKVRNAAMEKRSAELESRLAKIEALINKASD